MPVSGQVGFHEFLTQTGSASYSGVGTFAHSYAKNWDVTSGVGVDQMDQLYSAERTLATATNDDLDLSGTTLASQLGVNIAFVKVKYIRVESLSTNTTNLTIGNAAATPFVGGFGAAAHTWVLTPGDVFVVWKRSAAGWAVGAGASDLFRIANAAGASATYRITVGGTLS